MKKILGLDLGTNSIGWALISEDNGIPTDILGIGSRIIPLTPDDANEFSTGNAISKNQKRTEKRTARKGYDRYQLRRKALIKKLSELNMMPDETLIKLPIIELWSIRANAAIKQVSLCELGRVLFHLNQKRGYKHSKADEGNEDKKQKDYVADVNNRYKKIKELGKTIGQYFLDELIKSEKITEKGKFYTFRTKEQVFPRKAYVEEFDKIIECQKKYYPDILNEKVIAEIRDEIIYYQRNLKSCKHLVSLCEFELKEYKNKEGKVVFDGPKVTPRSSPIFQVCKIWESINNLVLKKRNGDEFVFTKGQRIEMFNHLDNNDKLTLSDLYKILNISKADGWWGGKAIGKGLQGNITKMQIKKALEGYAGLDNLLQFNLKFVDSNMVDELTGEIIQIVSPDFELEPLYKLWHTLYSISDKQELTNVLERNFKINDETILNNLFKLDFVKAGYGNKSAKAIRRILPYLADGLKYSDACLASGFRHSESLTKPENEARVLLDKLPPIRKNELKQPIVEKILNQMINIVNALIDKYGQIAEIRVELARELKQSKDERNATDKNIRENERKNIIISKRIEDEYGLRSSRSRIQKFRMWEEAEHKCFYCGQPVNVNEFLQGFDIEVEHIIPKSLLFDDSFSNKVCACRKCNSEKSNKTAYDYMKSKSEKEFDDYLERIEIYFKNGKISKTKRERLLTTKNKIPTDFIERQLRESQFIAKKAKDILQQVSRNVWATSGSVTDFVRNVWGWDMILHDLNFEKYKAVGMTELREFEHKEQKHTEERIKGWSKRVDHRHHAIDALTIACTKQSFIQRLNNLNTERDVMFSELEKQSDRHKNDCSLLQNWLNEQPHFETKKVRDKIDQICVSFKAGKKATSTGKRVKYENGKKIVLQKGIIIPRGKLHEEFVYGKIKTINEKKPVKFLFENPDLIFKPRIKNLIEDRIAKYEGDYAKAYASLKKEPVYLDKEGKVILEYGTCFKEKYVIKYPIESLTTKDIPFVIDKTAREAITERLMMFGNKEKEAFKDLKNNPIFLNKNKTIPIKTVRCYTGLSAVEPIKQNDKGEPIGFVKPGNNHHIAIYIDGKGNKQEHVVTFWHAVERKKYGIPVIIKDPASVWDLLVDKELPDSFLKNLPDVSWKFEISLQQNEMFILGMPDEEYNMAIEKMYHSALNKYLYRVQKLQTKGYFFRFQTETSVDDKYNGVKNEMLSKQIGKLKIVQSIDAWIKLNPHKVKVDLLGNISEIKS